LKKKLWLILLIIPHIIQAYGESNNQSNVNTLGDFNAITLCGEDYIRCTEFSEHLGNDHFVSLLSFLSRLEKDIKTISITAFLARKSPFAVKVTV
jgi:hypothetical protein